MREWVIREIRTDAMTGTLEDYPPGYIALWPPEKIRSSVGFVERLDAEPGTAKFDMEPMTLIECLEYYKRDGDNNPKYWSTELFNVRTGERIPLSVL